MSSGQEDVPSSKENEDEGLLSNSSYSKEISPEVAAKDQTDHGIVAKPAKTDDLTSLKSQDAVTTKTDTDSDLKDPESGGLIDPDMSSSDEDLHLQWEDETDEQEAMSIDNLDNEVKNVPEAMDANEESLEDLLLKEPDEIEKMDVSTNRDKLKNDSESETNVIDDIDKLLENDYSSNGNTEAKTTTSKVEKNTKLSYTEIDSKLKDTNVMSETDARNESVMKLEAVSTSSPNESQSSVSIDVNVDHRLTKPDVMLEIPTQEVIDILDDTDVSEAYLNDTIELEISTKVTKKADNQMTESINVTEKPIETFQSEATPVESIKLSSAVFELDIQNDSVNKTTVSENDWSEIEKKLEGFETSLVENSAKNDKSNKEITDSIQLPTITETSPSNEENKVLEAVEDNAKFTAAKSNTDTELSEIVSSTENVALKNPVDNTLPEPLKSEKIESLPELKQETVVTVKKTEALLANPLDSAISELQSVIASEEKQDLKSIEISSTTPVMSTKAEFDVQKEVEVTKTSTSDTIKPEICDKLEIEQSTSIPDTIQHEVSQKLKITGTQPGIEMSIDSTTDIKVQSMESGAIPKVKPTTESPKMEVETEDTHSVDAQRTETYTQNIKSTDTLKQDSILASPKQVEVDSSTESLKMDIDIQSPKQDVKRTEPSTDIADTTASTTIENEKVKKLETQSQVQRKSTIQTIQENVIETTKVEEEINQNDKQLKESIQKNMDIQVSIPSEKKMEIQSTELTPSQQTDSTSSKDNEASSKTITNEEIEVSTSQASTEIEVQMSTSKDTANEVQMSPLKGDENVPQSAAVDSEIVQTSIPKDTEVAQPAASKDTEFEVQTTTKDTGNGVQRENLKGIEVDTKEIQPLQKDTEIIVDTTSKENDVPSSSNIELKRSTSSVSTHLAPDSSDEVSEATDSLGLLAESSRVMEDDEEQDDEDDDDDDYYPDDESSNQMTAEHSEDSNQHSGTDLPKEGKETDTESPIEEKREEQFTFPEAHDKNGVTDVDEVNVEMTEETLNKAATVESSQTADTAETSPAEKQDVKTVKLSDTSDTKVEYSILKGLLKDAPVGDDGKKDKLDDGNIVDLEGSSSEDEIQEVKKDEKQVTETDKETTIALESANVTIPSNIAVTSMPLSNSTAKEIETPSESTEDKAKSNFSLEVFSLDSDEEESTAPEPKKEQSAIETDEQKAQESNLCINVSCDYSGTVYYAADSSAIAYYDAARKRKAMVCELCADVLVRRTRSLVEGIKDLTPLLDLDMGKMPSETVEISDSESDDEADDSDVAMETIGDSGADFIERELAKTINETWVKYKMDSRLTDAQQALDKEMQKLEEETKEIDALLNECQTATDQLRNDLYATFEQERHELLSLVIFDTPSNKYIRQESSVESEPPLSPGGGSGGSGGSGETRGKRRLSVAAESAPKRPAIPLGYKPLALGDRLGAKDPPTVDTAKVDDDKDIAVLKVSVEAAPSDLPPHGELTRPPLRADMCVYAMRNTFGSWTKAKIMEVQGKGQVPGASQNFTICRVKLFSKNQTKNKLLPARCLAYPDPADVRMAIGTRVIALFRDPMSEAKRDAYYSGIVAEVPNPVNGYRYLVFFDDGYAQYVRHRDTRLVCECASLVWEEVHPFSREFVRKYLIAYPERPMVRLHAGQSLKTEWNGKWWTSRVISVDASLVQVHFEEDNRTEWIYRGSTRLAPLYLELQAAERHRGRPMPRTKAQPRVNMPYVEYTRSDEQSSRSTSESLPPPPTQTQITAHERELRQRAVAKKSTATQPAPTSLPAAPTDSITSRVVYYTPKNAVKPYKMATHSCGPHCKRKDTLALKDLRTYNPLAKPLLSGWERQIVRYSGHKEVMYRAPCGRRLRNMYELHKYLRLVHSDMAVDLFDFTPTTHCLAEFVLNKCLVGKKDLSHGKENVPVPCVNYYDESLPEFCSYNTERTPTAGVPLNLDPEFLCGCDCTDDCVDKSKCACWKMTLEGARTIGLRSRDVGYVYKRLPEPLPSGIYECNSRCKCKQTCLNRVAQHPLQLKLQVFKTLNRGWGIRALNDVPKGSFLCVYAGNLLTDATANMDGLNEGDEYLAELDYIEVVEQMKEGYEEDIPEADKRLDKVQGRKEKKQDKKNLLQNEDPESSSSEEEELPSKNEEEDGDFDPGFGIGMGVMEFSKRLRKRAKNKKEKEDAAREKDGDKADDDCITISDDEEVREPARFMAQAGMESNEFVSKYRSVRTLFGKDEACYIMDAKVQGNIGRYLNHSCMPNVFVQNVFVDTHDPRFPWVAFFALSQIKAGTELTWNYNYDVGSVPGKALYCYCGAPNCRGRLL